MNITTEATTATTKPKSPRQAALENKFYQYQGKVCTKHPYLKGLRYTCNWVCVGCAKDYVKEQYNSKPLA